MKRNFDTVLCDLDGNPFTSPDKDFDGAPTTKLQTLRDLACFALIANLEGDQSMSGEAKLKQYGLVQKIHKGGIQDVTAEDISTIKVRAAKCLMLIAYGRVCEALEQDLEAPA